MPSVSAKQAKLMSAIKHGWHPPAGMHAPSMAVAKEFHSADKKAGKYMHADGGQVDITDPQVQRDLLRSRATPMPSGSERFLSLISHAADRATATVTDDPHHALARVASGLASQVAGQAPSGRVEFGRRPNLVNEAKSLPAGIADVGMAGSNILGGLADKYLPQTPGTIGYMLSKLRDAANAYTDKKGDPAPAWSRKAEEGASRMHQATNQAMNLSAPHGFTENAADALGTMLGQLPIPGTQAKVAAKGLKGGLSAMGRAVPEYLGPTIRPSTRNYLTGALGGGALGTLASMGDDSGPPPQVAETRGMLKEKYE